jgi:hypothetical protein
MTANEAFPRVEMVRIKMNDRLPVDQGFFVHIHRFKECCQFASRKEIAGAGGQQFLKPSELGKPILLRRLRRDYGFSC